MYISPSKSYALLRASRIRISSSPSLFSLFRSLSPPLQSSPSLNNYRFLRFSSSIRSLGCSVPQWSHIVHSKPPVSLRAQVRISSAVINRLPRRFSTMGTFFGYTCATFLYLCHSWCLIRFLKSLSLYTSLGNLCFCYY